jgi:hypothetical protein
MQNECSLWGRGTWRKECALYLYLGNSGTHCKLLCLPLLETGYPKCGSLVVSRLFHDLLPDGLVLC